MKFTDIFIRRPVLATVISLLILLIGLRAAMDMEVRQYPELESTVITVTTSYPGASSELVQGFVTTPCNRLLPKPMASTSSNRPASRAPRPSKSTWS